MLGGVMATLVGFAITAALARKRFIAALHRSEQWRVGLGYSLEFASALAVFALVFPWRGRHCIRSARESYRPQGGSRC